MKRFRLYAIVFVTLLHLSVGYAMPAPDMSEPVPVSRLIENTSRYIRLHPKDAEGYYTLARVHSIAFAQSFMQAPTSVTIIRGGASGQTEAQIVEPPQKAIKAIPMGSPEHYGSKNLPEFYDYNPTFIYRDNPQTPVSIDDLFHITESVRNYAKATELAPKESVYWLGLGWMLEQGAPYADSLGIPGNVIRSPLKPVKQVISSNEWLNQAVVAYHHAYTLNYPSIEAGENILRVQALPNRMLTRRDKSEVQRIQLAIVKEKKRISKRPIWISPIILPLSQETSLQSLLTPQKSVKFDLAGDGMGKRWPWVSSDTGILVYDPQRTGKITSGRQLFGSVTWWVFWKNGYQALDALDNNGDGILAGRELEGISLWRDVNGNGISDSGEVKPVTDWDIAELSTQVTQQVQGMPANLRGAKRRDGSILPTYDWTPYSLN